MKKYYLLAVLLMLFGNHSLSAQIITETFDNETNNTTSFSEGGITFNIASQQSYFYVQGAFPNTGWNGTANDNKYLDNSYYSSSSRGVEFTIIAANGVAINLKSMWIYVSTSGLNLSPIGTLTITGKRAGVEIFSVSKSNPFNPFSTVNNGFTLFDLATLGGQDNSNAVIDQFVISTDIGIGYLSIDALKFQCAPVSVIETSQTNVSCYGGNNGTATVVPGPSGTLSYDWAPGNPAGDGTASVTGLTAGTWTCTITNACGNSTVSTFNISQPDALSATPGQTNISCYGNATGSAGVAVSGGTAPYTYLWNTGATAATISDKPAGNYSVTITDAKGCTLVKNYALTQPVAPLSATTAQTNVACYSGTTGSASVIPSGGTAPYTYLWSDGQATAALSNISSGDYSVTITDANGCTVTNNVTISQPATALSATTLQTNVLCYGNATGSAGVTVSGGTSGYSYLWSTGATTASIANLLAGNYSVTITDAHSCTLVKSFVITQPNAALSAATTQSDVLCYGGTGSAGVLASGGSGGYTYVWSPYGGSGPVANNLAIGDYSVLITDANGCTVTKNITITAPVAALSATTTQTDILCYDSTTGAAGTSVSGGTAPYTYAWSSGEVTASITNKAAGNYSVTITDANGCTLNKSFVITQPDAPVSAIVAQTVTCYNGATGTAGVTVSGGVAPYTYLWSTGAQTATVDALAAGNYSVTITDANACSYIQNITIVEAASGISATIMPTTPLCHGESNGTAAVTVTGGTAPYTYLWSDGSQTDSITGLATGDYAVTVTDANNCFVTESFTLYEPGELSINTVSVNNNFCRGGALGSIYIDSMYGGTSPFTYTWSNGATGQYLNNLTAGTYSVVVTDANGCTTGRTMIVTEPEITMSATFTQTNVTCNGATNGAVNITPVNGIAPFDYQIFPLGFYGHNPIITGLAAGDYTVLVRDAYNCNTTIAFTITQPDLLDANIATTDSACGFMVMGTATATVTGGTAPYSYSWYPYEREGALADNLPGRDDYRVTITDANNCSITKNFVINNASECGVTTTWNGTSWSNGVPLCEAYAVVIEGDYNSATNGEILACSLTVNSGNVVVNSGDIFTIRSSVSVLGGSLTFESDANLIQYNDVANVGQITYKRNSSELYNLDYTLWSSPVHGPQTLKQFSPQTLDARFYVYNTALNAYSNYTSASGIFGGHPGQVQFTSGKGYLIRMPDGWSETTPSSFNGIFQGVPNNGTITLPLSAAGNRYNAVGNPYPSPLRLYSFLMDNRDNLDNGTAYFWRKRNGSAETTYTTVSLAGSVEGCGDCGPSEGGEGGENSAYMFTIKPGQGFFIKAAATATTLSFNNYMRWDRDNGRFYRNSNETPAIAGSKYWLNVTNDNHDFGQAAVAYMEDTTLDLDYGYDGRLLNDGAIALYTIAQDTKLSIQARDQFNVADEVMLGYKATAAGNFTIGLHRYTGVFNQGQDIYLVDMQEGIYRDIKNNGNYTFTTAAGTFNDRFKLVYRMPTLGTVAGLDSAKNIIVYKSNNTIVLNSGTAVMKSIAVYDIHGRVLYTDNDVNATDANINGLALQEQMLVVKVTTIDGYSVSKKIIY